MKKIICFVAATLIAGGSFAQKGKVQAAWRALSDYEATLAEGSPNVSYLAKAKEAIDLALTNEATRNQPKTHAYKMRISYAQFQYDLNQEAKKLENSISDKTERLLTAYGNTSLTDFETAAAELDSIKRINPKYLDKIMESISQNSMLDEDEMKFAIAAQNMKIESGSIASGKYKAKKYDDAADYFYKTAFINSILYKTKDTVNFSNACIAAAKAQNTDKILLYNQKMIDAKIAAPTNYDAIYNVYITKKDTASAEKILQEGRAAFPADANLLISETNIFLAKGMQEDALKNLKLSIQKDPSNAFYYFMSGNIYDNLANPKDKNTNKELAKPSNFDELFKNAETNYLKAIELSGSNQEYKYNALFNLGAMYNNYGGYVENYKLEKITDMVKYQKENGAKSQEFYKKAIPYLEQALAIKSDDKPTMNALRLLYFKTGNEAKAKEMNERLKK